MKLDKEKTLKEELELYIQFRFERGIFPPESTFRHSPVRYFASQTEQHWARIERLDKEAKTMLEQMEKNDELSSR
jgi:hypothetical protein